MRCVWSSVTCSPPTSSFPYHTLGAIIPLYPIRHHSLIISYEDIIPLSYHMRPSFPYHILWGHHYLITSKRYHSHHILWGHHSLIISYEAIIPLSHPRGFIPYHILLGDHFLITTCEAIIPLSHPRVIILLSYEAIIPLSVHVSPPLHYHNLWCHHSFIISYDSISISYEAIIPIKHHPLSHNTIGTSF